MSNTKAPKKYTKEKNIKTNKRKMNNIRNKSINNLKVMAVYSL